MDLTQYDDQQLDELRVSLNREYERRRRLSQLPEQAKVIAKDYSESGGDPDVIIQAVIEGAGPPAQ